MTTHHEPAIDVRYVETQFDRIAADPDDRPNTAMVWGLPFRAEYDGLQAAATSPEGARQMILSMLDRRAAATATSEESQS